MSVQYHLDELAIALNPDDPRHLGPPPEPVHHKVLDIGCGAGQTLVGSYGDRISFGIDIDADALRLGKTLSGRVRFVQATAEYLPFRSGVFDRVIARVSLPYTDIRRSAIEIRRVLKSGGTLWITLHPPSTALRGFRARNAAGRLYVLYVLLNGALLHLAGRTLPFGPRHESVQTNRGVMKVLGRAGFENIAIEKKGGHFVVEASAA
jgi:SAM-dependent methyltransferase